MTEDWELDFTNPPKIPPPDDQARYRTWLKQKLVEGQKCPMCPQTFLPRFGIPAVKQLGCSTIQEYCCSQVCAAEYALKPIREAGL
jgi:hypothetical protein